MLIKETIYIHIKLLLCFFLHVICETQPIKTNYKTGMATI